MQRQSAHQAIFSKRKYSLTVTVISRVQSRLHSTTAMVQFYCFWGNTACSGSPSNVLSTTSANNVCLVVTNGNGLTVDYSCNNNTKTVTPTAWITITAYNDATCSLGSTGWLSYACDVCSPLSPADVYYKLTCSQESSSVINYVFTNYTSSDCTTGLIDSQSHNLVKDSVCMVRNAQNNSVESSGFNNPFYGHAKYTLVTGSSPPTPPYGSYMKK